MSRNRSAEEVREEHIKVLGPKFGETYNALFNECIWLNIKWNQYVELYGTNPERIDLLNQAASFFSRVLQDALWENTLLHLTTLTDAQKTGEKQNLTIQLLPSLIENDKQKKDEIQKLVDKAKDATQFARDWRNRHIAHKDLALALEQEAEPLKPASRKQVKEAISAVSFVIRQISLLYFKSDLQLDDPVAPAGVKSLLYVIRDGLEAREKRRQRLSEGKILPEDMIPPPAL